MMAPINLIPAARRDAKRRRLHLRCCAAGCMAFVLLATSISLAWRAAAIESDGGLNDQLANAAAEIDQSTRAVAAAGAQLDSLRVQLRSNRHVLAQPDWSLLLALLGTEGGDAIVLSSCSLKGDDAATSGANTPRSAGGLTLHVSGHGKTNQSITDFVLRLENTHLFSRITLVDTTHETFLGSEAYRFQIDCPLETGK